MAYEGVSNYCHSEYDWSIVEENPSMMGIEMGEETDSAYQVVFRSYTGALVNLVVLQGWLSMFPHSMSMKMREPSTCLII